jgi:hypothetical protein
MVLNAKQRETKELAVAILTATGTSYDDALDKWHNEVIAENQKLILKSLKQFGQKKKEVKFNQDQYKGADNHADNQNQNS